MELTDIKLEKPHWDDIRLEKPLSSNEQSYTNTKWDQSGVKWDQSGVKWDQKTPTP